MSKLIPPDINEVARAIVEHYQQDLRGEDAKELSGIITTMICLGMGAERYRCANLAEPVSPQLASDIWSLKQ
jgi:hypothetical protein